MVRRLVSFQDRTTPQQRAEMARRAAVGLLGLLLGLFIGWVVWPAQPRDTVLDDLTPPLRAHYLSAVADAYVATGRVNAGPSLERLASLAEPVAAVDEAIDYYAQGLDPSAGVREVNLRALRVVLEEEARFQAAVPAIESGDEPAVGWVSWLLVAITAILLLVGTVWIAIQLIQGAGRDPGEEEVESFTPNNPQPTDEPSFGPAPSPPTSGQIEIWQNIVVPNPPAQPQTNRDQAPQTAETHSQPRAAPREESAPLLDWMPPPNAPTPRAEAEEATWDRATWDDLPQAEDAESDENDEEWDEEAEDEEEEADLPAVMPSTPLSAQPTARTIPQNGEPAPPPARSRQGEADVSSALPKMFGGFRRKDEGSQPEDQVNEYTFHYQHGIPDYDESMTITPVGKEEPRFGSCGMGIVKDLDPTSVSNNEARLLDVWFYDHEQGTLKQLLMSEGMDGEALAQKQPSQGTVTEEPVVAAPGVTFRLLGKNLVMACKIVEATYRDGPAGMPAPFQSVKVAMSIQRKRSS